MPDSEGRPLVYSTRSLEPHLVKRLLLAGISLEQADYIEVTHEYKAESFASRINNPDSQARVFTSKNSVYSLIHLLESRPFEIKKKRNFTVGIRATQLLEELGIEVDAKAGNAISLAQIIARNKDVEAVDFFCGDKSLDDLPEYLRTKGVEVHQEIVYNTEFTHHVVDGTAFDGIIFLSPTAVYSFFKKNKIDHKLPAFCIGATTSEAIHLRCTNPRFPSDEPSIESVVDKVIEYYSRQSSTVEPNRENIINS